MQTPYADNYRLYMKTILAFMMHDSTSFQVNSVEHVNCQQVRFAKQSKTV